MKLITKIAVVFLLACGQPAQDPEHPCGAWGHVCSTGLCCGSTEHCGGGPFNGCPEGYCCASGGDSFYSAKKSYPPKGKP